MICSNIQNHRNYCALTTLVYSHMTCKKVYCFSCLELAYLMNEQRKRMYYRCSKEKVDFLENEIEIFCGCLIQKSEIFRILNKFCFICKKKYLGQPNQCSERAVHQSCLQKSKLQEACKVQQVKIEQIKIPSKQIDKINQSSNSMKNSSIIDTLSTKSCAENEKQVKDEQFYTPPPVKLKLNPDLKINVSFKSCLKCRNFVNQQNLVVKIIGNNHTEPSFTCIMCVYQKQKLVFDGLKHKELLRRIETPKHRIKNKISFNKPHSQRIEKMMAKSLISSQLKIKQFENQQKDQEKLLIQSKLLQQTPK